MNDEDEILDVVDENDNVIGRKSRGEIYKLNLKNFRVVNAFFVNPNGKLWVFRRSPHEKLFPLGLDLSIGGHVGSGESYEEALRREAMEELGIDIDKTKCTLVAHLSPYKDGVSAFTKLYKLEADLIPVINYEEFVEGFWISPPKLMEMVVAGEPAKDDLIKMLKVYFSQTG
jgi:isopentenyl-diphosphate delta-isomerase